MRRKQLPLLVHHFTLIYMQGLFMLYLLGIAGIDAQAQAVETPERIIVSGNVISGDDLENLPGVHIYGRESRVGTVTNAAGMFRIRILKSDTLIFSYVGYITEKITFSNYKGNNAEVVIRLKPDVRELAGVIVYSEHLTPEYLLRPKREPIFVPGLPRPYDPGDISDVPIGSINYGPISYFSKEAKEKRLLMQSYERKKRELVYNQTINSQALREQFMSQYALSRREWDDFIVYFNSKPLLYMDRQNAENIVLHLHHEFRRYFGLRYED
ncbi:MAG: carboxypeptidase-like regulatory domain-containing protein [Cyclobacteriaceae bacterium]|nr:carboxypeptidase-like regulatory domain-containing protein [Cyclobacteriaceae bacterium]